MSNLSANLDTVLGITAGMTGCMRLLLLEPTTFGITSVRVREAGTVARGSQRETSMPF
jgi:hypothetical protein